jgi:CDP-diacylglycerol--glycerol-3-phosphate 3-phosphatidyltransferase
VARRFNQKSKFGAFIDPFADKVLLLTGIVFLSAFPWGTGGWRIPPWFVGLVIARDCVIIAGIIIIRRSTQVVHYQPHWSGKMSTVTQMFALGWVMLKVGTMPPIYPCAFAAIFTAWSGVQYFIDGWRQLHQNGKAVAATSP